MEKQTLLATEVQGQGSYWHRIKSKKVYSSGTGKIILDNNSEIQQKMKSRKKKVVNSNKTVWYWQKDKLINGIE